MKTLFAISVISIFLVGCGSGEPVTKRIYLMHGLRSTKADFDKEPFKTWVSDLELDGYDVITFDLPYALESHFNTDGGSKYKNAFVRLIEDTVQRTEAMYGQAEVNIAGGVSWGGLHALMAVEELEGYFDQYFAYVPVTDLTALVEFQPCCTSTNFNPWNDTQALGAIPGYIAWGNLDTRVDYTLSINLVDNIEDKSRLVTREWNLGHESTPESLQAITDWLVNLNLQK